MMTVTPTNTHPHTHTHTHNIQVGNNAFINRDTEPMQQPPGFPSYPAALFGGYVFLIFIMDHLA